MRKVVIGFVSGEVEQVVLSEHDIKKLKKCIRPGLFWKDRVVELSPINYDNSTAVESGDTLIVRRKAISAILIGNTIVANERA